MSFEKIEAIKVHDNENIKGFFQDYRWLSNFHVCKVFHAQREYTSTEAAYMAAKTHDPDIKNIFQKLDPKEARRKGQEIKLREDWDDVRLRTMFWVNMSKYMLNNDLKQQLIATGSKYLEETNWWNDKFWGVCKGIGENHLGNILMHIRELAQANYI
jgi:ribA/ribD-fused uncharacterized protein